MKEYRIFKNLDIHTYTHFAFLKFIANKTVIFAGDPSLIGQIVSVHITEAQTWVLKGALAE